MVRTSFSAGAADAMSANAAAGLAPAAAPSAACRSITACTTACNLYSFYSSARQDMCAMWVSAGFALSDMVSILTTTSSCLHPWQGHICIF